MCRSSSTSRPLTGSIRKPLGPSFVQGLLYAVHDNHPHGPRSSSSPPSLVHGRRRSTLAAQKPIRVERKRVRKRTSFVGCEAGSASGSLTVGFVEKLRSLVTTCSYLCRSGDRDPGPCGTTFLKCGPAIAVVGQTTN